MHEPEADKPESPPLPVWSHGPRSRASAAAPTEALPLQFGLRGLLWLQAICAAFFAALVLIGGYAVLLALIATVIYAAIEVPPEQRPIKRLIIDLMGGIILPCLCLYYDPMFLRIVEGSNSRSVRSEVLLFDLAIGFQMCALAAWLAVGRRLRRGQAVFSGVLTLGTLAAALVGVALLPASLLGIVLAGYGLLGLTPFLTMAVYARSAAQAWKAAEARGDGGLRHVVVWLGLALAVAVPVALYYSVGPYVVELFRLIPSPQTPNSLFPFRGTQGLN